MHDEVVLVTGGSSGIGLETARLFAAEGARVVLVARDPERLRAAAAALGGNVRAVPADVSDAESVRALAADVAAHEGRLDVLVNSAGAFDVGPLDDDGMARVERIMQVNYLGTARTTHALLPLLRRGSRRSIVNLSSLAGKVAPPHWTAYSASKFAVAGFSYALRQELRPEGFHVGLVSPGPVDTPLIEGKVGTEFYPKPPLMGMATPETVAKAVLRMVRRRKRELVVPWHAGPMMRLAQAFPVLVDLMYRLTARPRPAAPRSDPARGRAD